MKNIIVCVAVLISLAMPGAVSLRAQQITQQDMQAPNGIVQPKRLSRHELFSEDHTADVIAIQQLWSAYDYYMDTTDGPGMASLFTSDAIFHLVANVRGKIILAASLDNAGRCPIIGAEAIGHFLSFNFSGEPDAKTHDALPFPGNFHHFTTSVMVKVNDDGKTAMLTATALATASSDVPHDWLALPDGKGPRFVLAGEYRTFLRKTSEGWQISELYAVNDPRFAITAASMSASCKPSEPAAH